MNRYVSRLRGRAIRATGVPQLPNLPSPRALVQNELRHAVPRVRRARTPGGDDGSRPTKTGRLRTISAVTATVLGLYLLIAPGNPPNTPCPAPVNAYGHSHCKEDR